MEVSKIDEIEELGSSDLPSLLLSTVIPQSLLCSPTSLTQPAGQKVWERRAIRVEAGQGSLEPLLGCLRLKRTPCLEDEGVLAALEVGHASPG